METYSTNPSQKGLLHVLCDGKEVFCGGIRKVNQYLIQKDKAEGASLSEETFVRLSERFPWLPEYREFIMGRLSPRVAALILAAEENREDEMVGWLMKKSQLTEAQLKRNKEIFLKGCHCRFKEDDDYVIDLHIVRHGRPTCRYTPGSKVLKNYHAADDPKNHLRLPDAELRKVEEEAKRFEELLRAFDRKNPTFVELIPGAVNVWYVRESNGGFSFKTKRRQGSRMITELHRGSVDLMIHELAFLVPLDESEGSLHNLLYDSDEQTIEKNPLYLAAVKSGDLLLARQLKAYYAIATPEESRYVNEMTGASIIPTLPAEYDRKYYVKRSSDGFYAFVRESGFYIAHRPYFAMRNSTHEAVTLNPHTKSGVDAAPVDGEAISLDEFLKLYEEAGLGDFINEKWRSGETQAAVNQEDKGEENQ